MRPLFVWLAVALALVAAVPASLATTVAVCNWQPGLVCDIWGRVAVVVTLMVMIGALALILARFAFHLMTMLAKAWL